MIIFCIKYIKKVIYDTYNNLRDVYVIRNVSIEKSAQNMPIENADMK